MKKNIGVISKNSTVVIERWRKFCLLVNFEFNEIVWNQDMDSSKYNQRIVYFLHSKTLHGDLFAWRLALAKISAQKFRQLKLCVFVRYSLEIGDSYWPSVSISYQSMETFNNPFVGRYRDTWILRMFSPSLWIAPQVIIRSLKEGNPTFPIAWLFVPDCNFWGERS